MKNNSEEMIRAARLQGEAWHGIRSPSDVATRQGEQLVTTWRGFVDLRDDLSFEDEPSSFVRVLKRCGKKQS